MTDRFQATALGLFSMALCIAIATPSLALPANPQRPLAEQTCEAALARLAEAQIGSPLVPVESHPQLLAIARADVARLCE